MRLRVIWVLPLALALTTVAAGAVSGGGIGRVACAAQPTPSRGADALRARQDVLGHALVRRPGGPTYDAARGLLAPLHFARAAGRAPLTDSGAYYLPFGIPAGVQGATSVALHVADGSQIVSRRVGGSSFTVSVGADGRERYGSCLARLTPARLADGWLPILRTGYRDAAGSRYRQESFAARAPGTDALVSFVRLDVDARAAVTVRLSGAGMQRLGPALVRVPAGTSRTIYAGWLVRPARRPPLDADAYDAARASVERYWRDRLDDGMTLELPERRVQDAARALLVQNLILTWRYSSGNAYEQFSFPEGVDVAQVLDEQGFAEVAAAILRTSLTRKATPYPNWKKGEKLLGYAEHYRLTGDGAAIARATPVMRGYVAALGRQIERNPRGLLDRERYSSDIPDEVYGLHSQAVVWAGLRGMAGAWAESEPALAATCRRLATRLEAGLRRAVRESQRRLPDGSLFVPVRLLDDERAYGTLTEARLGSYWNLVMPYALASGLFAPESVQARGIWRYMQLHGSRLLGLVRAGAYALYGTGGGGTDQVYGINVARFLADNGEADELVLSLYGMLAAAFTPDTYVAGEAASVAAFAGLPRRAMYLPPNGAANAAFLETLRLLLVHETATGVELAPSTPRAWLRPGSRLAVRDAPTRFGRVSFSLAASGRSVAVSVDPPPRARRLTLRLRLPPGRRIVRVTPARPFDAAGTIDLSGLRTGVEIVVAIA